MPLLGGSRRSLVQFESGRICLAYGHRWRAFSRDVRISRIHEMTFLCGAWQSLVEPGSHWARSRTHGAIQQDTRRVTSGAIGPPVQGATLVTMVWCGKS